MARPKKNIHTREKLLAEGMSLLSEHGYHGTGLKIIIDTVNVSKGSFYNYFKSKEVFVAEIIKQYNLEISDWIDTYLNETNDDPVTIIRNVHNLRIIELEKEEMRGCLVGNLAAEIGTTSELCRAEMQQVAKAWNSRLETLITDAQQQGLFRTDLEASALTDIFWSAWQGGMLKMKIDGNTDHLKEVITLMLDYFFRPATQLKE